MKKNLFPVILVIALFILISCSDATPDSNISLSALSDNPVIWLIAIICTITGASVWSIIKLLSGNKKGYLVYILHMN